MRIAYHPPSMCSSCFGQYLDRLHVDFEAVWDGPAVNNDGTPYSVDELVLCEDCLRSAVALLPAADRVAELERLNAELVVENERLAVYAQRLQAGVSSLESALEVRPAALIDVEAKKPAQRRKPVRT